MNRNKILSSVFVASMAVGNTLPVLAATNETQTTNENTIKETEVLYEQSASYFVTIPKTITLDGATKSSNYNVKVEGDIPSDKEVYVSPIDGIADTESFDFYMKDPNLNNPKNDVVATITQSKTIWNFEDVANSYEETTNTIVATNLTAGTWKGNFEFEINMRDITSSESPHEHSYIETIIKQPTTTEKGEKLYTCECGDSYTEIIPIITSTLSPRKMQSALKNLTGSIVFTKEPISNITNMGTLYDISEEQNGSIIAVVESQNATIYSDYGVIAPIDSEDLFRDFKSISIDLTGLNTSNVIDMSNMFYGCSNLTSLDLTNFTTNKVLYMNSMFSECSNLTSLNLTSFNTKKVYNMSSMFSGCSSLATLDLSHFDTSNVTDMSGMFTNFQNLSTLNLNNFDTSNVTDMNSMFLNSKFTSLDLRNFDTSNVTDMHYMFYGCNDLTTLNINNFNTVNVTNMEGMFESCENLTSLDVSNFNTTNVTDMSWMFAYCKNLTGLNLSNFNTSNAITMNHMLFDCESLVTLDISNFNTHNVADMSLMFSNCHSLEILDISNFDTINTTDMSYMFSNCYSFTILDISNFDTSNTTDMSNMFYECNNLKTIYVSENWTTEQADTDYMFGLCGTDSVTLK